MCEKTIASTVAWRRGTATADRTPSDARLYRTWKSLRAKTHRTARCPQTARIHCRTLAGSAPISRTAASGEGRCDKTATARRYRPATGSDLVAELLQLGADDALDGGVFPVREVLSPGAGPR